MGSPMGLIGYLIVVAALLKGATAATTYVAGDSLGWTVPPNGSLTYENWARSKTFQIGDRLVFYWNDTHTAADVSKADYESCTMTSGVILSTNGSSVTLTSSGSRYFICTVGTHCELGQKVTITVEGPPSPPPPPPSSASSLTVGSLSALLISTIVMSFFRCI